MMGTAWGVTGKARNIGLGDAEREASASAKPRLARRRGRRTRSASPEPEQPGDERLRDAVVEAAAVADRRRLLLDEVLAPCSGYVWQRGVFVPFTHPL